MSDYAYVAERARKIFASVSRLENDLAKSPDSWAAQRNLRSMQKLASQAREELERLASVNHIDVCDYRIIPTGGWQYALEHVAQSFLQYQWLFSQVYDAIRNGPKSRSKIGKEAAAPKCAGLWVFIFPALSGSFCYAKVNVIFSTEIWISQLRHFLTFSGSKILMT